MTALKVKDPVSGLWTSVPTVGPVGPPGPEGPQGVAGAIGEFPTGGATSNPLTKLSADDGDVQWGGDIAMTSGARLRFGSEADREHIHLYADTFGFGITSGSLNLFASSTIRFKQNGIDGTEWAYIDAAHVRHGNHDLQRQIYQNGAFSGPWDGEGTALWTPSLQAGNYWVMFGASGTSTAVAARTIDLKFDDVIKATARIWINAVNVHTSFVNGIGMIGAVTQGSHTIKIVNGGSTGSDVNDYGWVLLVPYT